MTSDYRTPSPTISPILRPQPTAGDVAFNDPVSPLRRHSPEPLLPGVDSVQEVISPARPTHPPAPRKKRKRPTSQITTEIDPLPSTAEGLSSVHVSHEGPAIGLLASAEQSSRQDAMGTEIRSGIGIPSPSPMDFGSPLHRFVNLEALGEASAIPSQEDPYLAELIKRSSETTDIEEGVGAATTDEDEYLEAILAHEARCICVDSSIFVLEHFADGAAVPGIFHHVRHFSNETRFELVCDCKSAKYGSCIHSSCVRAHWQRFDNMQPVSQLSDPVAIEVCADHLSARSWVTVLAAGDQKSRDGKRTIVALFGTRWTCRKCGGGRAKQDTCVHRQQAHRYVTEVMNIEILDDEDAEEMAMHDEEAQDQERITATSLERSASYQYRPVSHLPIPPPPFARLPEDTLPPARFPDPRALPGVLALDEGARCRTCFKPAKRGISSRQFEAQIFTSCGVLERQVEVQFCGCRRKHRYTIGPDLASLGVFNWNNACLFSHELLNHYLAQFTASETPLRAFHAATSRQYLNLGQQTTFISMTTFNRAYFAYISLIHLPTSLSCPEEGPMPSSVILDGFTLAYASRLRSERLSPHTRSDHHSSVRNRVVYPVQPQLVMDAALRRQLSRALDGLKLVDDGGEALQRDTTSAQMSQTVISAQLSQLPAGAAARCGLKALDEVLRLCIDPPSYHVTVLRSLHQLLAQASASESVLQLCPPPVIDPMRQYAEALNHLEVSMALNRLRPRCPAIWNVHRAFEELNLPAPPGLLRFATQLSERADTVFKALSQHDPDPPAPERYDGTDWKVVGAAFGAPQIRSRPCYPRLRGEPQSVGRSDTKGPDETCGKYYSTYGKARLTGGVMGVWCRHGFCVSWHCIGRSEGRNDPFSALYTHWPTAPCHVVYDFCCAEAPYCLVREPKFFADTLFVIDELHARDHTKCSEACFISNYMAHDPLLHLLNSSAAECGNNGARRVKKTVSYCSEEHAVLHTGTYFALINRVQMLRLYDVQKPVQRRRRI